MILIGGHEARDGGGERTILKEVSRRVGRAGGRLAIVTVATGRPTELGKLYTRAFKDLGVTQVEVLNVRSREEAEDESAARRVSRASAVFFTGGDQLRMTSLIGDSLLLARIRRMYEEGATVAGTSAGAAAMPETMLISGPGDQSDKLSAIGMAPGLRFVSAVVIDSHFAERGRFARLLGAVAQNPGNLGLGIDEDTAVIIEGDSSFRVIGTGAVYVVDGSDISYSSLSEERAEGVLSIFNVKLHVLGSGNRYHLARREPIIPRQAPERAA